ncbi:hypothetical protein SAMN02745753_03719 [Marinomonas polaris DSM 16579]|uniref:Uncharacterized protein n=1 Tax=Marinomonas polaris DSM 16579 TaxID=1122206 RepID=A0A1M5J0W0_9GAMM|nr:hypothetical protein [Marinomonas polaris]SHG33633.1 hypothetical protein SAMN02745753_03719 [Marinomonas polaris DSM 16579]
MTASNDLLVQELREHRKVSSAQHSELRTAVVDMAKSVSELTVVVARSEERHLRQDDGLRRIGKQVDDHELRIRTVETVSLTQKGYVSGGWKVATVVAAIVSCAVTVGVKFL